MAKMVYVQDDLESLMQTFNKTAAFYDELNKLLKPLSLNPLIGVGVTSIIKMTDTIETRLENSKSIIYNGEEDFTNSELLNESLFNNVEVSGDLGNVYSPAMGGTSSIALSKTDGVSVNEGSTPRESELDLEEEVQGTILTDISVGEVSEEILDDQYTENNTILDSQIGISGPSDLEDTVVEYEDTYNVNKEKEGRASNAFTDGQLNDITASIDIIGQKEIGSVGVQEEDHSVSLDAQQEEAGPVGVQEEDHSIPLDAQQEEAGPVGVQEENHSIPLETQEEEIGSVGVQEENHSIPLDAQQKEAHVEVQEHFTVPLLSQQEDIVGPYSQDTSNASHGVGEIPSNANTQPDNAENITSVYQYQAGTQIATHNDNGSISLGDNTGGKITANIKNPSDKVVESVDISSDISIDQARTFLNSMGINSK